MGRSRKARHTGSGSAGAPGAVAADQSSFPAGFSSAPEEGSQASKLHAPVLFTEVLSFLRPQAGMRIVDGTLGLGGHAEGMLRLMEANGITDATLLGLDRDAEALRFAAERLAPFGERAVLRKARFSRCVEVLDELGWDAVDFALVDIGVSSMQLDTPERGFSFSGNGPLDMRMDKAGGPTAASLVNKASVNDLRRIIAELGEEPMAGRIARAIEDARSERAIESTEELARIVWEAYPAKWRATARNHPATRTFQALRMAVNGELEELEEFLRAMLPRLAPGGRLAVISFHSLEDRLVKHFFRDEAIGCRCPRHVPVCICDHTASLRILTKKPVTAKEEELSSNPRAGSAKLRVAEKLPSR